MTSVLAPLSLDWRFRSVCCRPVFQISVWWYVADDAVSPCLMEVFSFVVVVEVGGGPCLPLNVCFFHFCQLITLRMCWILCVFSVSEAVPCCVVVRGRSISLFFGGSLWGRERLLPDIWAHRRCDGGPWRFLWCDTVSGRGSESRCKPQLMREFIFLLIWHLCRFRLCFPQSSEGLVWFAPLSFVSCAVPIMLWDATICSYVAHNCFLFSLFVIVVVCPLTVLPLGRCPTLQHMARFWCLSRFGNTL